MVHYYCSASARAFRHNEEKVQKSNGIVFQHNLLKIAQVTTL